MATFTITGKSSWTVEITYNTSFDSSSGKSNIYYTAWRLKKGSSTTSASSCTDSTFYLVVNGTKVTIDKYSYTVPAGGGYGSSASMSLSTTNVTPGARVAIGFDDAWGNLYDYNSGTTTIYAASYPTYTISYNMNGGSGSISSQVKTWGTTLKLSSTIPTRTNYDFLGWSTSSTATSATYSAGGNYTLNSAATLYAVWKLSKPSITVEPTLSAEETSIKYSSMSASISGSTFEYKIGSSGTWTSANASGGTISGLSTLTKYIIYFRAYYSGSGLYSDECPKEISTYGYPCIQNFTADGISAGGSKVINLYNPLSRSVEVYASVESTQITDTITTTGTSVSLTMTLANCSTALGASKSSGTVTYTSYYSGVSSPVIDEKTETISISAKAGAPSINTNLTNSFITYVDCNTTTTNVTTSTSVLLGGKSKIKIVPSSTSSNNPFTTLSPATISSYKMQINSGTAATVSLGTSYYQASSDAVTSSSSSSVTVSNSTTTLKVTITATDTRGFSASVSRTIAITPYTSPVATINSLVRSDGYGSTGTLNWSVKWSDGLSTSKGTYTVQLKYKKTTDSSYSTYATAITTNPQSINSIFDSNYAYNVYLTAVDPLMSSSAPEISNDVVVTEGNPILFIDSTYSAVGIDGYPSEKGFFVNGKSTLKGLVQLGSSGAYNISEDGSTYSGTAAKATTAATATTAAACTGNAATATTASACSGNSATATTATNATNTYVTTTNPTSTTVYNVPFVSGTENQGLKSNDGVMYRTLEGTTSADGWAILQLGNTTTTGTAGNKKGQIRLYNACGGCTQLQGSSVTSGLVTSYLPTAGGTLVSSGNLYQKSFSVSVTPSTNRGSQGWGSTTVDTSSISGKILVGIYFTGSSSYMLWGTTTDCYNTVPSSIGVYGYRIGGTYTGTVGCDMIITYLNI